MKREVLTISLDKASQERLKKLALEKGFTWGTEGNISDLMRAIADSRAVVLTAEEYVALQDKINSQNVQLAQIAQSILKLIQ